MGWKAACFAVAAPAGEAGAVRARGALSQRSCGAWLFVSVRTPGGSPLPAGRRPLRPLSPHHPGIEWRGGSLRVSFIRAGKPWRGVKPSCSKGVPRLDRCATQGCLPWIGERRCGGRPGSPGVLCGLPCRDRPCPTPPPPPPPPPPPARRRHFDPMSFIAVPLNRSPNPQG